MDQFWKEEAQLKPFLREKGIPFGTLGPDTTDLVAHWLRGTMTHYEHHILLRQQVVQNQLQAYRLGKVVPKATTEPMNPDQQAQRLARLSPQDWTKALKALLGGGYSEEALQELLRLWESPKFSVVPTPIEHASEVLYIAMGANLNATLVIVPEAACVPHGAFQPPTPTFLLQILRESLVEDRAPMPPITAPSGFATIRPPKQPSFLRTARYPHLYPANQWYPLPDQEFGWTYLAQGAILANDLNLWAGDLSLST